MAEEAAWKFAKENNIQLAVINPSFVLGPPLSDRTDSTSIKSIIGFLRGAFKNGATGATYGCVDVRDVALAHVRALERSEQTMGHRHLVTSEHSYNQLDISDLIRDVISIDFPEASNLLDNLPTSFSVEPKWKCDYNLSRLHNVLGIELIPLRQTLHDMIQYLFASGLVGKT